MTRAGKILERILQGDGEVSFREFQSAASGLGFVLDRISGSHHIFRHPRVPHLLNIQPVGNSVKRYQLRQFRDMVLEFGLLPEGR